MVSYDWYITLTPNASHTLALLRELGALDETHIAPTYGEYLSDTETIYDGYRNPEAGCRPLELPRQYSGGFV